MTGSNIRTRVSAGGKSLDLHLAAALREHLPGNLESDSGSAADGHGAETWTVVDDLNKLCVSSSPLDQLNVTIRARGPCRVGQDIGERPPEPRADGHYVPGFPI